METELGQVTNSLKCFIIKELAAHCLATVFNYLFDFWKDFEMAVLIAKRRRKREIEGRREGEREGRREREREGWREEGE